MYFLRTPLLDLSADIQQELIRAIHDNELIPTGMNENKNKLPFEQAIPPNIDANRKEYLRSIYYNYNALGYTLNSKLDTEIKLFYNKFLSFVNEEPRITVKRVMADEFLPLHSDRMQTVSVATLINGSGPVTEWYEIKEEYKAPYLINGKLKGQALPMEHEVTKVAEHQINAWESILFDHRSVHKVVNKTTNNKIDRWFLSIGWINVTHDEASEAYKKYQNDCI